MDVKSAFLQIDRAERDVYVHPTTESDHKKTYLWIPNAAVYGMVNANHKYNVQ